MPEGSQGGLSGVTECPLDQPIHGAECPEPSPAVMRSWGCVHMCRAPMYQQ